MLHLISEQEKQEITQKIDLYLKNTFRDKTKGTRAYVSPLHNRSSKYFVVEAKRNRFYDLYIRFNSEYANSGIHYKTIVIARIFFEKTQKKLGSRLLYALIQAAKPHGYKYMMIESANDNSSAFGKRLGFEAYNHNSQSSQLTCNYFISINKLENFLKDYL